jgi:hypothetical protein
MDLFAACPLTWMRIGLQKVELADVLLELIPRYVFVDPAVVEVVEARDWIAYWPARLL